MQPMPDPSSAEQPSSPAAGKREVTTPPDACPSSNSDNESSVDAKLVSSMSTPDKREAAAKEGDAGDKRKRAESPPFEWSMEVEKEAEPDGYLELRTARPVEVEVAPRDPDQPTFLPLPLPSKRAKTAAGSRAVLIPVERLPVFPLPPLPPIDDEELVKQVREFS